MRDKKEDALRIVEEDTRSIANAESNLKFDVQMALKKGARWEEIADILGLTATEAEAKYS